MNIRECAGREKMNNKVKKFLKNPFLLFLTLGQRGFFNWIPDSLYLKIAYRIKMGGGKIRFSESTII